MMEPPSLSATELLAKWKHVLDATFDIWSWTSPSELCWLAECASRATTIFEIGCYHGRSTKIMSLASQACCGHITAFDVPESERCRKILIANLQQELEDNAIRLYLSTAQTYPEWADEAFGAFCFIDGGHLASDLDADISTLKPKMRSGAIMAGHDWRHNDMNDGVNRGVLAHFKLEELRFHESIWYVKLP